MTPISTDTLTARPYLTSKGETAYSIAYGHPDGFTVLITPDSGRWIVWHSTSLNTLLRTPDLDTAIEHAKRSAANRARRLQHER